MPLTIRPGVRYMMLSALAFSVMSALVKAAGSSLPSQEIVFVRALVALVLSWAFLVRSGVGLWGTNRRLLLLRGVFGFCGLSCFFYALTHLPIAEATVIQYMHPIFTAILAGVLLREHAGIGLVVAIALSVCGVLLVTGAGFPISGEPSALDAFAVGVAAAGAFFSACAYVVVRRLAATEHPLVIVFYFPLVTLPASLPTLVPTAVWPDGWEWTMLLGVGLFAQLGQVCLTRGMQYEPAGRASALSYLQILFAAGWGILLFDEIPDLGTVTGAALILLGTAVAIRSRGGAS